MLAAALSACASTAQLDVGHAQASNFVADHIPTWAGGEPAATPARQAAPPPYPNLFATPPARQAKPLTNAEQQKLQSELVEARNRATARAKPARTREQEKQSTADLLAARDGAVARASPATNDTVETEAARERLAAK